MQAVVLAAIETAAVGRKLVGEAGFEPTTSGL